MVGKQRRKMETFKNELNSLNLNIFALDAPGHGLNKEKAFDIISYSKVITEAINTTKPNYIVAHSIGTMSTVVGLNNSNHKTFEKIVLMAPVNNFSFILNEFQNILSVPIKSINALVDLIKLKYQTSPSTFKTSNYNISGSTLIIHDKQDKIIPYSEALEIKTKHPK